LLTRLRLWLCKGNKIVLPDIGGWWSKKLALRRFKRQDDRRANMNERLGILFLHNNITPVVEQNLRSIRRHNPEATLVTMSTGKPLPGGYTLEQTLGLKWLHSLLIRQSSDRLVCSWFLQRKESCDKWWIVEWDTFCAIPVREYYRSVWHFPFVAASVRLKYREPEWDWFQRSKKIPADYEPFVMGAVPFLYLLSEPALSATCRMLLDHPLKTGNGELRFATAAHRCGFTPCGFSPPNDQITWINWKTMPVRPAIVHPLKEMMPA